jgi:ankyrin repeat protein
LGECHNFSLLNSQHRVDVNEQYKGHTEYNYPYNSKVETVQLLIEHGADVTAQDENHLTPLHLASSSGIPEIVRLLLERGARVTAQDKSRKTPLHLASSWVSATAVTLIPERR